LPLSGGGRVRSEPECDREIRSRRVRKDTPMQESGREPRLLPNGKATSDSRGPAAHHGVLAVHTAQAVEAAVLRDAAPRREPERVGGRMTLEGE
jgi:hypothetical protein